MSSTDTATTETRLRLVTSEDVHEARKLDAMTFSELANMALDCEENLTALTKLAARLRSRSMRGDRLARQMICLMRDELYSLRADLTNELGDER